MRRIVSALAMIPVLLVMAAAVSSAAEARQSVGEEAARRPAISFTDEVGHPQQSPFVSVEDAYPGMRPVQTVVTLSNDGTQPMSYDFSVTVTYTGKDASLADWLSVTVQRVADREVVYRGSLSKLAAAGDVPLLPGARASYFMTTRWPDRGAHDNARQGLTLEFEFDARGYNAG